LTLFRLLLPASLVIFFSWKSFHCRIFLLGIPFLQVMGNSIFLEKLIIFTRPARLPSSVLILEWVFFVWVLTVGILDPKNRNNLKWRDLFGPPLVFPEEGLLIVLVGVWFFNFVSSIYNTMDFNGVFITGVDLGCMFLGYLLVRGIISNATRRDIDRFLYAIILINAIAAILYILNQGLHFPIYEGDQHQTEVFMGTLITRTFWWMPRFYFLTIAFVISRSKWNLSSIAILIITFTNAFFSYSRNTFIIYGCMIALALIISAFKRKILRSLLRLVGIIAAGILFFWVISLVFPAEFLYLNERFQEINSSPAISSVSNFAVRLDDYNRTYAMIQNKNPLSGLGMVSQVTNPAILYLTKWTADITWVGVLYRYGVIGVIFFTSLFITFGYRALNGYFQTTSQIEEEYWLMFFLIILATLAESFISWTILDPRNITLSLWFFAFIAVMETRKRVTRLNMLSCST
jgi:hypothetical protein